MAVPRRSPYESSTGDLSDAALSALATGDPSKVATSLWCMAENGRLDDQIEKMLRVWTNTGPLMQFHLKTWRAEKHPQYGCKLMLRELDTSLVLYPYSGDRRSQEHPGTSPTTLAPPERPLEDDFTGFALCLLLGYDTKAQKPAETAQNLEGPMAIQDSAEQRIAENSTSSVADRISIDNQYRALLRAALLRAALSGEQAKTMGRAQLAVYAMSYREIFSRAAIGLMEERGIMLSPRMVMDVRGRMERWLPSGTDSSSYCGMRSLMTAEERALLL